MSKVKINQNVRNGVAYGKVSDAVRYAEGEYYVIRFLNGSERTSHRDIKSKHKAIKALRDWLRYNR